jgi:hypothetical protein
VFADLWRYYGVDLRDLWRPGSDLTPRAVLWLVEHLPQESATIAAMKGGGHFREWTTQNHLLAGVFNLLAAANRQRAGKAMRKAPIQPPKPKAQKRRPAGARVVRISELSSRANRQRKTDATGR